MPLYRVKVVSQTSEKVYECDGYNVTNRPESGYYRDHPEITGVPKGKLSKLDLMRGTREGSQEMFQTVYASSRVKVYIESWETGKTLDRFPRERKKRENKRNREEEKEIERGFRVVEKEPEFSFERSFGERDSDG